MKKLFLCILLSLMWCNIGFARDFNYTCVLDVQYQVSDNKKWHNKKIKFNIYNSGNIIKFFNKNINYYYPDQKILINNTTQLVSSFHISVKNQYNSFVLNKNTLIAKYSNMFFDDEGGGEYGVGKCE